MSLLLLLTNTPAPVASPPAFQSGAFQSSAFQSAAVGVAFQPGAFQFGAFQTSATATATSAVGSYGGTGKRKYIVKQGNRLLVFRRIEDAQAALQDDKEPQEVPLPEPVEEGADAPEPLKAPEPVETVDLHYVQEIAQARGEVEAVRRMLAQAEYMALLTLLERMQDEEDVEMLLLAS